MMTLPDQSGAIITPAARRSRQPLDHSHTGASHGRGWGMAGNVRSSRLMTPPAVEPSATRTGLCAPLFSPSAHLCEQDILSSTRSHCWALHPFKSAVQDGALPQQPSSLAIKASTTNSTLYRCLCVSDGLGTISRSSHPRLPRSKRLKDAARVACSARERARTPRRAAHRHSGMKP
jgi:hypothetical protein